MKNQVKPVAWECCMLQHYTRWTVRRLVSYSGSKSWLLTFSCFEFIPGYFLMLWTAPVSCSLCHLVQDTIKPNLATSSLPPPLLAHWSHPSPLRSASLSHLSPFFLQLLTSISLVSVFVTIKSWKLPNWHHWVCFPDSVCYWTTITVLHCCFALLKKDI